MEGGKLQQRQRKVCGYDPQCTPTVYVLLPVTYLDTLAREIPNLNVALLDENIAWSLKQM